MTIPARSEVSIKVSLNNKCDNHNLFGLICTGLPFYEKIGASVANALVKIEKGETMVPLINPHLYPKNIDAGAVKGSFEELVKDEKNGLVVLNVREEKPIKTNKNQDKAGKKNGKFRN